MIRFITFLVLVVGGMEVIQPAGVQAGVTARIDLGSFSVDTFQRRQTTGGITQVPSQCKPVCDPINGILTSGGCTPSQCCLASFDSEYFNCFICVGTSANVTDYSEPQSIIDTLYDQCASLGFQLPVFTFPGQNTNRTLSSVVLPSSSQTTIAQITIGPSTSPATIATSTQATVNTPIPTSTSSFGIRSVETTCCFSLLANAIMLGTWFYLAGLVLV